MVAPKNKITRSISPKSLFESCAAFIDSTVTFNQGDLLSFNTSTKLIERLTSGNTGSTFLGLARESIAAGKKISPYNTDVIASQAAGNVAGPLFGVIAKLLSKASDVWAAGALVYAAPEDGQSHVSSSSSGATRQPIGIYQGAGITASASGEEIEVFVGARFPDNTLKF